MSDTNGLNAPISNFHSKQQGFPSQHADASSSSSTTPGLLPSSHFEDLQWLSLSFFYNSFLDITCLLTVVGFAVWSHHSSGSSAASSLDRPSLLIANTNQSHVQHQLQTLPMTCAHLSDRCRTGTVFSSIRVLLGDAFHANNSKNTVFYMIFG